MWWAKPKQKCHRLVDTFAADSALTLPGSASLAARIWTEERKQDEMSHTSFLILTLLKMEFEEGGVVLKFHFKIPFLQSCFLSDQYSSSFHVIGKQVKIKYLRLAPEELSTCQTEAAHV